MNFIKVSIEISSPAWIFSNLWEGTENFLPTAISNTHSNTQPCVCTHTHMHTPLKCKYFVQPSKGYHCDSYTLSKKRSRGKNAPTIAINKWEIIFFFLITHSATNFQVLLRCSRDSNLLQPGTWRRIVLPNVEKHFQHTGAVSSDKACGFKTRV